MVHPINSHNFGVHGIAVSFHNGSTVVTGYVVKQTSTNTFLVTDGTTTGSPAVLNKWKRKLAPTSIIAADLASNPTYCTMPVEPANLVATGATFHVHYKVDTATVLSGGTNFNVGDVLALPDLGRLTVATLSSTAIATVTVSTPGDYTDSLMSDPTTATRAAGTGAAFTAHYAVDSATVVSGGTNFNVADVLTLGTGAGALTVATAPGGVIGTVTVSTPGDYSSANITGALAGTQTAARAAGAGATFTPHYFVIGAVKVNSGTGYTAGDVIDLAGSNGATIVVDSVTGGPPGPINTFHIGVSGDVTALLVNPVGVTGPGNDDATFTLTYGLDSVATNGAGTGYNVGDTLIFTDMAASVLPTAHISVATDHAATTVVVDGEGSAITAAASSITTSRNTATFTLKYNLLSVATDGAGTGYNVGEQLVFTGMTATTMPTAQISVATAHAATTVTRTAGAGITVPASAIAGSANSATFNLKYKVLSVASSGGTGYAVTDPLVFNGMVATTMPVATITTSTDTAATAVTSTTGAGITTAASSVSVAGPVEYIRRIWDTKVLTVEGHTYHWTLRQSVNGSAIIVPYS